MPYEVFLKSSAEKELENFPEKLHDRIVTRLFALKENPRPINSKRLRGREGYRIRVGDYRILYVIEEDARKVEVYSIAHRRDVNR